MSDEGRSRTVALTALRRELTNKGFGRKPTAHVVISWPSTSVLAVGGLMLFFASDNLALKVAGMLISTAGSTGVGTNTHTSSHYATSERRWVNEALTFFGYPFFLGLSATFWWNKHVVVHHPAPNVIDVDDDADFMPWLALTERDWGRSGSWRRLYYRHLQWWLSDRARRQRLQHGAGGVDLRHCRPAANDRHKRLLWIDLGCLILHLIVFVGVPAMFVSLPVAVGGVCCASR